MPAQADDGQRADHPAVAAAPAVAPADWRDRWARHAWRARPTWLARLLQPLSWCYAALATVHRLWWRHVRRPQRLPVPVVVVGNVVVGGAGKTPVVIAVVQALREAGYSPGVVARGYGRRDAATPMRVRADGTADDVGDEPLLILRRTGAPVAVGARRAAAARLLLAGGPAVDVIVSDDGLQHHALAHDVALVVFDRRALGNGLMLPAGPLRQPAPAQVPANWLVLQGGGGSLPWPAIGVEPQARFAVPLQDWWSGVRSAGVPLAGLRGRPLLALAGIGDPRKFFDSLRAAGLDIVPWPMPDHARYAAPPWPAGTAEVVTTEKDAVKLPPHVAGAVRVWVVPLDLALPPALVGELLRRLPPVAPRATRAPHA